MQPKTLTGLPDWRTTLAVLFALAVLFVPAKPAHADVTVYPGDGVIHSIRYSGSGVEIKMTEWGLVVGYFYPRRVADVVELYRQARAPRYPRINRDRFGWQVWLHCQASRFERRHSNPINVFWREIT